MKTFPVAVAKRSFSKMLQISQKEEVIVTKHGRPLARLRGIEGESMLDVAERALSERKNRK
jgi:prevent-host-death family protein